MAIGLKTNRVGPSGLGGGAPGRSCLAAVFAAALLSGCVSFTVPAYAVSEDNVQQLRALHQKYPHGSITLAKFPPSPRVNGEVECRADGPVRPPEGMSYAAYLHGAFEQELEAAGLAGPHGAPVEVQLQTLEFGAYGGDWRLTALAWVGDLPHFRIVVDTAYDGRWGGGVACSRTADAFVQTTQALVQKVISSPEFENALAASGAGGNI